MLAQCAEVKKLVYASKQMTAWDVIFEIEGIKELILAYRLTHHDLHLRQCKNTCKSQANPSKNQGVFQQN
jgi:hypothetical protein